MESRATKFTDLQLEILRICGQPVNEEELKDIKNILVTYFAKRATEEMDKVFEERGWDMDEKMKEWTETKMRTPYKLR